MVRGNVLLLSMLVLWLGVFSSCEKEEIPLLAERTVLIYMVADNNLAGLAKEDLEELKKGMASVTSETQHLLVYADMGGSPRLIEVIGNGRNAVEREIKTYSNRNSTGLEETLEVFRDVFTNKRYVAESYGLVYWSHCDGWIPYPVPSTRWIGQDAGNGDNRMNLSDFLRVMDDAPHFDFIMFDACFMQDVEVAYALRNHTDYYIASPTEIPGPGAPYDKLVPWMFVEGAAAKMGEAYYNAYNDLYNGGLGISNSNWTGGTSICVLRSDGLESLAAKTKEVLKQQGTVDPVVLRSVVFDYDQRERNSQGHVGYYDMSDMMMQLVSEDRFDDWKNALDAVTVYWNTTPKNYSQFTGMFSMKGACGVTHYIPSALESAAHVAYRDLDWYEAAGLTQLGW